MAKSTKYQSSINFKRTPEEKADPYLSWIRPDKNFFAAGACHILAFAFLEIYPDKEFKIMHIRPKGDYSGNHVYVTNGKLAFDFGGWKLEDELLEVTKKEYERVINGWDYERIVVMQTLEEFCQSTNHRLPQHFFKLPWDRAYEYIEKFKIPNDVF